MSIGHAVLIAILHASILMGVILGGIIKMICTLPLSFMALTIILLPLRPAIGIAFSACFAISFTNHTVSLVMELYDR